MVNSIDLFNVGLLVVPVAMAFSRAVAIEIGRRDHWTCQMTGKRFQDGILVDASHRDHNRKSGYYDEARNGEILSRTAHLEQHIRYMIGFGKAVDRAAVELLAQRNWGYIDEKGNIKEGLHTYLIYNANPDVLIKDRQEILDLFKRYRLNPAEFIDFESNKPIPDNLNLW